ncbi:MAG: hypothetical protein M3Z36_13070 [Acidobacteriota bacterium]|nr:hypothetical protein [Acidobacteriota bacterium]
MIATSPPRDRNPRSVPGVAFGLAVTMGSTIGVGILRTPGTVASLLGNVRAMIPKAGGFYVFALRAFGESAAFGVGWCDWLGNCAASRTRPSSSAN